MTKREARKAVLRCAARMLRITSEHDLRPYFGDDATGSGPDRPRLVEQLKRLADHLDWQADGGPKRG